jgi:hypothetical protein
MLCSGLAERAASPWAAGAAPAPAPRSCIHSRLSAGSLAARGAIDIGPEPPDGDIDGLDPRAERGGTEGGPPRALAGPVACGSRGGARRGSRAAPGVPDSVAGGENEGSGGPATWPGAAGMEGRAEAPSPRKPSITWRWASMISRVVRRYSRTAVSRSAAAGAGITRGAVAGRRAPGGSSPVRRPGEVAVDEPRRGRQPRRRSGLEVERARVPARVERRDIEGDARGGELGEGAEELLEAGLPGLIAGHGEVRALAENTSSEPGEHAARADLDEDAGAGRVHGLDLVDEAHGRDDVFGEARRGSPRGASG